MPVVEIAAASCAAWAAWASRPRPPTLEWERLFKSTLSVLSWSDAEAELRTAPKAAAADSVETRWRMAVAHHIPFHPAGRQWHLKLALPHPNVINTPALEGERALVEALARLSSPAHRWERLFGEAMLDEDLYGAEALGDPRSLGPAYDPSRLLGPQAGWEGVSAWSDDVRAGLGRRLSHVVVLLTGQPRVGALENQVNGLRVVRRALKTLGSADDVLSMMASPSDRLVWIHGGAQVSAALRLIADAPVLVDRLVCLMAVGGEIVSSDNERQALADLLQSDSLLPELQRQIPLVSVSDVDPEAPTACDDAFLRFPFTDVDEPVGRGLRGIDLGPLPVERVPPRQLGRALVLTLAFLLDG